MNIIKIFIASSSELQEDRSQLESLISRKNKTWINKNVFFEAVMWEDFIDALSSTRLQDEYNRAIRESDIFINLFYRKVGKYTAEEFETAIGSFKENRRPFIYIYFKQEGREPLQDTSVRDFRERLRMLGHFETIYHTSGDLCSHFYNQMEKLYEKEFKFKEVANLNKNLFGDALEFLQSRDYNSSAELLQRLLSSEPARADYNYYLALALLKGRHPRGLRFTEADTINKYLERACNSKSPQAHYFYLWAFIKANFYLANGFPVADPPIKTTLLMGEKYPTDQESFNLLSQHLPRNDNILDLFFGAEI